MIRQRAIARDQTSVRNIDRSFFIIRLRKNRPAEAKRAELDKSGRFRRPIVTQIEPAPTFYRAEEYHQRCSAKHGRTHCALSC